MLTARKATGAIIFCAAMTFSFIASAQSVPPGNVLTIDQVAQLRLDRQNHIDQRNADLQELIVTETKIQILTEWAAGEKPSVIKETLKHTGIPMASSAALGFGTKGVLSITSVRLLMARYLPKLALLATRYPRVAAIADHSPWAIGLIVSLKFGVDYYRHYGDAIGSVLDTPIEERAGLYGRLKDDQQYLLNRIKEENDKIINLDAQLKPYDDFTPQEQQQFHYSIPSYVK